MTSELQTAEWAYDWCALIDTLKIPYRWDGGHGVKPVEGPHGMWIPPTVGEEHGVPPGYDCSGALSSVLWRAGVLGHQEAINTQALECYGLAGVGKHMTVRTLDIERVIHHCFLQFTGMGPARPDRLFAAQVPGTLVGWFHAGTEWVNAFTPRHPG